MDNYLSSTHMDETITKMRTRSQTKELETNEQKLHEECLNKSQVSQPITYDIIRDNDISIHLSSPTIHESNELEARSKLAKAQGIKRQLERLNLEHQMQLLAAKREVELAELECSAFEAANNDQPTTRPEPMSRKEQVHLSNSDSHFELNSIKESLFAIVGHAGLPKLEINLFDGNPTNYLMFTRQFDNIITPRVSDKNQLLSYLIHYCQGQARRAIETCITLPSNEGYPRARKILKDLYGQEHLIARAHIEDLVRNTKAISNSAEDLTEFALTLRNSQMSLEQMGYTSDLNAAMNIERIVCRLPFEMRTKWADIADGILVSGREPDFEDLATFIEARARTARTRYGQLCRPNTTNSETHYKAQYSGYRWTPPITNNTGTQQMPTRTGTCPVCRKLHAIGECPIFLGEDGLQRRDTVRKYGLCYLCLGSRHNARSCRSNMQCSKPGCLGKHHPLLHVDQPNTSIEPIARVNLTRGIKGKIFYGTVPIRITGPKGTTETYAFVDSGADTSLVSESLTNRIGITGNQTRLSITTISGEINQSSQEVELDLWALDSSGSINVARAYTIPVLPLERVHPGGGWNQSQWEHLRDVKIPELPNNSIEVLIGSDTPMAHWALEQRLGGGTQPFAIRSHLGWRLLGPTSLPNNRHHVLWCGCTKGSDTQEDYARLFEHEFQDLESHEMSLSLDDQRAVQIAEQSCRLIDGHIEVSPPWKNEKPNIDNLPLALGRLRCLRSRLVRDQTLYDRYCTQMENHIQKGHIELVPMGKGNLSESRWFIPHHPVINPKKPDKLRIVFDCAAKYNNTSLNDYLLQGPNTVNSLVGVLLRFRLHQVAIAADIEEMFLQVKIPVKDRTAFSLLWWTNGNLNSKPDRYQLTVHPFGAISSPFCANYALQSVITQHDPTTRLKHVVNDCFYVDDYLASIETPATAIEFIKDVSDTLIKGGFKLTKWVSNDKEVLSSIHADLRTPALKDLRWDKGYVERTLGMKWDTKEDAFRFDHNINDRPLTKRGVLSTVSSIFDPLGLISPFILPAKLLLQRLCASKIAWDAPISNDEAKTWNTWKYVIERINELTFPRCYHNVTPNEAIGAQIHIFCDASEKGYGAAIYLRYNDNKGNISCSLVMSKSKVAPRKTVTIPRLELTAATLGARMYSMIKSELKLQDTVATFWCDSVIVLHYINNTSSRYQTFVANRLTLIHGLTHKNQWRYIPSEANIADWTSRGLTKIDNRAYTWIRGPPFLYEPPATWPTWRPDMVNEDHLEIRATCMATMISTDTGLGKLIRHYSDWMRLLKAVAWLTRYKQYLRIKQTARTDLTIRVGRLTIPELRTAEIDVVRFEQGCVFQTELHVLRTTSESSNIHKPLTHLQGLNPIIAEGLLLVGGRLQHGNRSLINIHPVILPCKGHITELILRHIHRTQGHIGASQLLAFVRRKYWIIHGGLATKRITRGCITCKRISPRLGCQVMAPLPFARVNTTGYPFTSVGTDFFGPFLVKRGRVTEKRYGCIFTCMQIRAIHIEITHSMSSDSFLMALMRFSSRRGYPTEVFCDNGSNIVGAHNELTNEMNSWSQDIIHDRLLRLNITWHFNPPSSSHRGGVWERMIRSIRKILNAIMQERVTTDECLLTYMTEVERIINDRPLTPVTSDPNDLEALTPAHLLLLRNNDSLMDGPQLSDPIIKRWRQVNHLADIFWKRWLNEYLPLLQCRQKWCTVHRDFTEGDIVIVNPDTKVRGKWPLGRIVKTLRGTDGKVRTIEIKTANSTLTRDIRNVCLLEAAE